MDAVIGELDQVGLVELTDKLASEIWGVLAGKTYTELRLLPVSG